MIPAREAFPGGWVREYYGFLVAQLQSSDKSSSFVCLFCDLEYILGGSGNVDGAIFYMVEAMCSSLSCAPNDKPLHMHMF